MMFVQNVTPIVSTTKIPKLVSATKVTSEPGKNALNVTPAAKPVRV